MGPQRKPLLPPITVNGVAIDPAFIAAEAQNHSAPKNKPGLAWYAAARALIVRELLLQEAERCNIFANAVELLPGQWETPEEALIRQLLDTVILSDPVDEIELRSVYYNDPDRFRAPSVFEAAHILFAAAPDDDTARKDARCKATAILDELRRNPHHFADLARHHSMCSSKSSGGLLGQLSSGDTVPEFESVMVGMTEGELAIAETRYGIHVIRLDAKEKGDVLPFETVLPRLRDAHFKAIWTRRSHEFVAKLIDQAKIDGIDMTPGKPEIAVSV